MSLDKKRTDYISWGDFFMGVAQLASLRSKDPNTQVGSCIVKDKKIIGVGYNGMPNGCSDDILPWGKEGDPHDTKYAYVVHSEVNSVLNCSNVTDLKGATVYCTLFPCNECAKVIIQAGIKEIFYLEDKYDGSDYNIIAKRLFSLAGVSFNKFVFDKEILMLVKK